MIRRKQGLTGKTFLPFPAVETARALQSKDQAGSEADSLQSFYGQQHAFV